MLFHGISTVHEVRSYFKLALNNKNGWNIIYLDNIYLALLELYIKKSFATDVHRLDIF
jgi:hypothetical protein